MLNETEYNTIKIKILEKQFIFEQKTYKPEILSLFISRKDYNKIIGNANIILSDSKIKKMQYEKISTSKWIIILTIIVIVLLIMFIIFLFYSPRIKNGDAHKIIGIITGTIFLFLLLIIELNNIFFGLKKKKDIKEFYLEPLNIYLKETNNFMNGNICFEFLPDERMMICKCRKVKIMGIREVERRKEGKEGSVNYSNNRLDKINENDEVENSMEINSNSIITKPQISGRKNSNGNIKSNHSKSSKNEKGNISQQNK